MKNVILLADIKDQNLLLFWTIKGTFFKQVVFKTLG